MRELTCPICGATGQSPEWSLEWDIFPCKTRTYSSRNKVMQSRLCLSNVMEARDELECGKTYEDVGRNREIITSSVIGEVHSMDEVYVINEVSKFHGEI